ncbi:MAG: hypothetical protein GEV12_08795 [Micromonosporaceae bacterium]|nr:hypothetical protein [Micromonosporaceae bacterium]
MSPRRNHPRRRWGVGRSAGPPVEPVPRGAEAEETWRGEVWRVRQISGGAAVKTYRCPGCDQEIRPGVPHLVAWPVAGPVGFGGSAGVGGPVGGAGERRHWHTGCWNARERRRPTS